MRIIDTPKMPKASGHYSMVIEHNGCSLEIESMHFYKQLMANTYGTFFAWIALAYKNKHALRLKKNN